LEVGGRVFGYTMPEETKRSKSDTRQWGTAILYDWQRVATIAYAG
jgi:hypothetical protein